MSFRGAVQSRSRLNVGVDSKVKRALQSDMSSLLTVGQLAARAGVSADTIRYYERVRVLPKAGRTPAGYRQYPETVLYRIALVRNAQRFGFSLRQIADFLRVRDHGGKPCYEVRAAAQRMLDAVDHQIEHLTTTRERMRDTLRDSDQRLADAPAEAPARLLETLTADDAAKREMPVVHLQRRRR
jgi:DNA-binding transcriptional MerR regulator